MQQILNKLSEIETTARRIMEDADWRRQLFPQKWNSNAGISMQLWSRKPTKKYRNFATVLKSRKTRNLHFSDKKQRRLLTIWMLITDKTTKSSEDLFHRLLESWKEWRNMGNLLSYSGISTKIRAMYALPSEEQILEILSFPVSHR